MDFAKEFITKLYGKVQEQDMGVILKELQMFVTNYDIEKKETRIVEYESPIPDCYKKYIISKKIEGLSTETLKTYNYYLTDFFENITKPISELTCDDIRVYLYNTQIRRRIHNRTLDGYRLVINGFLEWCYNEEYILKNVCKSINPIKYNSSPREPLTNIELELLRDACKNYREKALVEVFYSTGCRVSELVRLTFNDIDFQKKEVTLFGKGNKIRTSYLNAKSELYLKKYIDIERKGTDSSVFVSSKSPYKGLKKTGIESIIRNLGERSGIGRRVYPHLIRHTTATDALNRGMKVTEVQKILGHEKLDTTMIYAKVSQDSVKYNHKLYLN